MAARGSIPPGERIEELAGRGSALSRPRWVVLILSGLVLAAPFVLDFGAATQRGAAAVLFVAALSLLFHFSNRLRTAYEQQRSLLESASASESRYRSLVEVLPAVVYSAEFGDWGASRDPSPQIEAMLGYEAEDWASQGIRWFDRVHPEDRSQLLALEQRSQATGDPLRFDYRMVASDGHEIWVRDEALVVTEGGRPALHGVIHDVTDQKRAEAVLEDRSERLGHTAHEQMADLHESELGTVYRLAIAAEMRDDETHAHALRVGRSAALLAVEVGLPARQAELIKLAAPLHDIGKLGLSDAILKKAGPLTPEERDLMQRHAEVGRQILDGSTSEVLRLGAEIAFTHHEWWDGSGYPRGLEEERIPIAGRLTAIADAFDAMTHRRPYKEAWPIEQALAELGICAGTQFDPWLVEAFEDLDHESLVGSTDDREDSLAVVPGWPAMALSAQPESR